MADKRIFYLTRTGLAAYEWTRRRLHCAGEFQADEAGGGLFWEYLGRTCGTTAYVLVDLIEEEFRVEQLPHARGRDRAALHTRHAARLFRDAVLFQARVLGRSQDTPRNDEVLFSAITNCRAIAFWLDILLAREVPVAGIFSVPRLSQRLVKPLGIGDQCALVVTEQSHSGLRHTFFDHGRLKFSRLTPVPSLDEEGYCRFVLDEIGKTRRYLAALHMLPRDAELGVHLISGEHRLDRIAAASRVHDHSHYHLNDVAAVWTSLGLGGFLNGYYCDSLFVRLLASRPPASQYAKHDQQRFYTTALCNSALKAASLLIAVGGLLWSGYNGVEGTFLSRTVQASEHLAFQAQADYQRVAAKVPSVSVASSAIYSAVQHAQWLTTHQSDPVGLLVLTSKVLEDFPELTVERADWFKGPLPDAMPAATHGVGGIQAVSGVTDDDGGGDAAEEKFGILVIEGSVQPFDGDYRAAHRLIGEAVVRLDSLPETYMARVESMPVNTDPDMTINGATGMRKVPQEARFQMRIVEGSDE